MMDAVKLHLSTLQSKQRTRPLSRRSNSLTWRPSDRFLRFVLGITLFLNLADAILTLAVVQSGLAVEANPLMEVLISSSPLLFMFAKLGLVSLGVLLLWRLRERLSAVIGSMGAFSVYNLVVMYHIHSLATL